MKTMLPHKFGALVDDYPFSMIEESKTADDKSLRSAQQSALRTT
jgi:hypothetical protein